MIEVFKNQKGVEQMSETSVGTLTVYERMPDPLAAQQSLGRDIAKSGFFGCGSIEQGNVLAMECFARGMPPMMLAERYHIIQNRLSMKADAMLAAFQKLGGWHNIIEYSPDACEIKFNPPPGKDEQPLIVRITWVDAQKEKWPYGKDGKDGKPTLKDNWSTPLGRQDMLWARVISRGVKKLRPEIAAGYYTPEEISDFGDEPTATVKGNGQHKTTVASPTKQQPEGEVIDASFVVVKEEPLNVPSVKSEPEFVSHQNCELIQNLFAELGMTADQQTAALTKRKASSIRNLTVTVADELIAALKSKLAAIRDAKLPSLDPASSPDGATCGPCTPEQERAIKAKFAEWKQIDSPAADAALAGFTKKLFDSGRKKIADLSASDATRLAHAIDVRKLDSFFQRSLETWKPLDGGEAGATASKPDSPKNPPLKTAAAA